MSASVGPKVACVRKRAACAREAGISGADGVAPVLPAVPALVLVPALPASPLLLPPPPQAANSSAALHTSAAHARRQRGSLECLCTCTPGNTLSGDHRHGGLALRPHCVHRLRRQPALTRRCSRNLCERATATAPGGGAPARRRSAGGAPNPRPG